MLRRQRARRAQTAQPTELDMTTFLNLMVVLVPFLLITAVFSRITIVELDMPSSQGGASSDEPDFRIEVIVRDEGFEVTNGHVTIAAIPLDEGAYDLATLTDVAISLKRDHPEATRASVLLEPQVEYDHLIQVMDAVRSTSLTEHFEIEEAEALGGEEPATREEAETPTRIALFTDISIGDAP